MTLTKNYVLHAVQLVWNLDNEFDNDNMCHGEEKVNGENKN